jgi:HK97 gp10 family phage protein
MASPMVVHGLKETQAKMTKALKDLQGPPMLEAMRDATLMVQRDARKAAPVFSGELRASILPEIRTQGILGGEMVGVVGSKVAHALYMEKGTRPHFPPVAALRAWARRRGMVAFVIARAISRRGTKPRRFLQGAYDSNKERIVKKFDAAIKKLTQDAN